MSLKTKEEKKEEKHEHYWIFNGYEQNRCQCGAIEISESEECKRNEEWRAFDAMVRETESYRDHLAMKQAWKDHNKKLMKEILERVDARLERDEYMPHPSFPDPATFPYVLKEAI